MSKKSLNFMNSVPVKSPKQSAFDLTHDVKLSCNMGYLIPTMVMDCVPGDKVNITQDALLRFAPLISPMYQRVNVTFHTWAVPYRLLWYNWGNYITETKVGSPTPVLPAFPYFQIAADGSNYSPLLDYLGIPNPTAVTGAVSENISAMRIAAYQMIYNEFYRDQNLVPNTFGDLTNIDRILEDGDNTINLNITFGVLRKRAWEHDYFTSNLPFAQKGEAVDIPLAPVQDVSVYSRPEADFPLGFTDWDVISSANNLQTPVHDTPDVSDSSLYANTSTLSSQATTINELRLAFQLQKYLEKAARSGTRLVEWIKGMFDETLPDYTAQRPQYIGGLKSPVQISEVLNTTGTVGELPQGNMSGRGIAVTQGKNGYYHAREHCVIMTLMSVMPETSYQQGIEREWSKINDPKDFLNPLFAHLGEQETKKRELMGFGPTGDQTFGYLPRYAEYRTIPSRVAGDFRTTLQYWTMSRIFANNYDPSLNQDFIECDATHRVFADTDPADQKLYVHVLNKIRAVRPLPKYGTPSI